MKNAIFIALLSFTTLAQTSSFKAPLLANRSQTKIEIDEGESSFNGKSNLGLKVIDSGVLFDYEYQLEQALTAGASIGSKGENEDTEGEFRAVSANINYYFSKHAYTNSFTLGGELFRYSGKGKNSDIYSYGERSLRGDDEINGLRVIGAYQFYGKHKGGINARLGLFSNLAGGLNGKIYLFGSIGSTF